LNIRNILERGKSPKINNGSTICAFRKVWKTFSKGPPNCIFCAINDISTKATTQVNIHLVLYAIIYCYSTLLVFYTASTASDSATLCYFSDRFHSHSLHRAIPPTPARCFCILPRCPGCPWDWVPSAIDPNGVPRFRN
jgi:hypothetical protein